MIAHLRDLVGAALVLAGRAVSATWPDDDDVDPAVDEPLDVEHRLPASRLYWLLVAAGLRLAEHPRQGAESAAGWVLAEIELRGIESLARPTERTR